MQGGKSKKARRQRDDPDWSDDSEATLSDSESTPEGREVRQGGRGREQRQGAGIHAALPTPCPSLLTQAGGGEGPTSRGALSFLTAGGGAELGGLCAGEWAQGGALALGPPLADCLGGGPHPGEASVGQPEMVSPCCLKSRPP